VRQARAGNSLTKTTILAGLADSFAGFFRQSWIRWFSEAPKMSPSGECPFSEILGGSVRSGHAESEWQHKNVASDAKPTYLSAESPASNHEGSQIAPKSANVHQRDSLRPANVVGFAAV
jgi:hypothetical protein